MICLGGLPSSGSSRGSSSSSSGLVVNSNNDSSQKQYTRDEVLANMTILQRPGNQGAVKDGISGKTFSSLTDLLKYYDI